MLLQMTRIEHESERNLREGSVPTKPLMIEILILCIACACICSKPSLADRRRELSHLQHEALRSAHIDPCQEGVQVTERGKVLDHRLRNEDIWA